MQRRSFVATATAGLAGLAGCTGVLSGSDDSTDGGDGPEDAARSLFEAAFDGDVEGTNAYLHSDAEIEPFGPEYVEEYQDADARVESTEVVEQSGDTATVSVTYSALPDDGSERRTATVRVELRTEDGEWRVYDDATGVGRERDRPSVPTSRWDTIESTNDAGEIERIELVATATDSFPVSRLSVLIGDTTVAPASADTEVAAGTTLVTSFDGDGAGPEAGSELRLVWSSPGTDGTHTMASHVLSDDAAGSVAAEFDVE